MLCAKSNLQFLNAVLSLETPTAIDLLLAVQVVFRDGSALRTVLAFLSNLRMQLNVPSQSTESVTRPEKYRKWWYTDVFGLGFLFLFSSPLGGL